MEDYCLCSIDIERIRILKIFLVLKTYRLIIFQRRQILVITHFNFALLAKTQKNIFVSLFKWLRLLSSLKDGCVGFCILEDYGLWSSWVSKATMHCDAAASLVVMWPSCIARGVEYGFKSGVLPLIPLLDVPGKVGVLGPCLPHGRPGWSPWLLLSLGPDWLFWPFGE